MQFTKELIESLSQTDRRELLEIMQAEKDLVDRTIRLITRAHVMKDTSISSARAQTHVRCRHRKYESKNPQERS